MEALRFGASGLPLLVFPTSQGRFYQWEDFGMVPALQDKIDAGFIQLWCVDSVDSESWYASGLPPADRVRRHLQYERYIVDELLPQIGQVPVATGTSLGAFHAVLLALRRPEKLSGFVALSGAYDTKHWLDGYFDNDVYFTNPLAFLPGLRDEKFLGPMRGFIKRVIASGEHDPNAGEAVQVATLLREKAVGTQLDLWPGWSHDWPYWREMMRAYV
jgi:esterase/lipase superfamily enzyme